MFLEECRHFRERLTERLERFNIPYCKVAEEMNAILRTDWSKNTSYAVKLKRFDKFFGQKEGDYWERSSSNGEVLWLIIRPDTNGVPELVTFFFRRINQPSSPRRFSVDKILNVKDLMDKKVPRV